MNMTNNLLDSYRDFLIQYNEKLNLVSRRNVEGIIPRLISESLVALDWNICEIKSPMLDIGSGGGIPGIPLKIVRPDLSVELLDSNHRKTLFLQTLIQFLSLKNVGVISDRAEKVATDILYSNRYNTIVTRGVAPMEKLLLWGSHLLKPGGELIVWKGSRVYTELTHLNMDGWDGPEFKRLPNGPVIVWFQRV
ncbi:MAG: 16S rRNA (guanine(527)-N(7))-methyltransferase RsmG [Candidatus Electryoneaceae bacterium]|nr:16S rRNA (guanine(527)-N(7))-methyltransferase RsmG [Candidatus Electryoneaceae bacterium]